MNHKTNSPAEAQIHESTYALLMRSEERPRGILEIVVFALFVSCAVFSLGQFAGQSVAFPLRTIHSVESNVTQAAAQHFPARS